MFLVILELGVIAFGIIILFTQILIPIGKGLPIFPALRKTGEIQETIVTKQGELHEENLLDQVDQLDTKIIEKKNRRSK